MSQEKIKSLQEQIDTEAIIYATKEVGLQFGYGNNCVLQFNNVDKEKVIQLLKENNIGFEEANINKLFYYDRAYLTLEDKVIQLYDDNEDAPYDFWTPSAMSEKYFDNLVQYLEDTDPVADCDIIGEVIKGYLNERGCGIE